MSATDDPTLPSLRHDLLLPNSHPAVQEDRGLRLARRAINRRKNHILQKRNQMIKVWCFLNGRWPTSKTCVPRKVNKDAKWIKRHKKWAQDNKAGQCQLSSLQFNYPAQNLHWETCFAEAEGILLGHFKGEILSWTRSNAAHGFPSGWDGYKCLQPAGTLPKSSSIQIYLWTVYPTSHYCILLCAENLNICLWH